MKGIFWNSNVFSGPKNISFLADITKEKGLNFIAVSETRRSEFTPRFIKNMCVGKEFIWHSKSLKCRSGGIVLGIDMQCFDIGTIDEGEFYVKFHLCNRKEDFK
jgi:hypothetical protein